MINIKTLVYFDLEATGLKSSGRPRISEIAFVAVNFEDIGELHLQIQNQIRNKNNQDYTLVEITIYLSESEKRCKSFVFRSALVWFVLCALICY